MIEGHQQAGQGAQNIHVPEMVAGETINVSASLYRYYRQCPDRALAHLEGNYGDISVATFKGGLAHRLFARHLTAGPIEQQDLGNVLDREIRKDRGLSIDKSKLEHWGVLESHDLELLLEQVGDMYEQFCEYPLDGFQKAELDLKYQLAEGVRLRGRLDALFEDDDGKVRLVDWKTGDLWPEDMSPMLFYAMMWTLDRGTMPALVELHSLETGEIQRQEVTRKDLQKTADEVAQLVNEARPALANRTRLLRITGPLCQFCPILDDCAEGKQAVYG